MKGSRAALSEMMVYINTQYQHVLLESRKLLLEHVRKWFKCDWSCRSAVALLPQWQWQRRVKVSYSGVR